MERTTSQQIAVVIGAVALWLLARISPVEALPPAVATAALFCVLVGWSAVRYRRSGWITGLLFVLMVVAMIADLGVLAWHVWYAHGPTF